ncbi:hypothetical protein GCM10009760_29160 [Kitasatospora kazusensis]|uniref:DUF4190 domain-containing protein n=1 Tax=Kitasatospora kazusensis TaxID=407974 RepID=A0ABN2ZJB2_9ACTN
MTQQDTSVTDRPGTASRYADGPPMGVNRFAGWARICGLLALAPFAVVFGVIALVQVRRSGQRGRGAAVVGMAAAVAWVLLGLGVSDLAGPQVQRDHSGGVSHRQADSVFDLGVGDCFTVRDRDPEGGIQWVLLVPCSQQHDGQVYATPALPRDSLDPEAAAKAACRKALPSDMPADASLSFLYPESSTLAHGRARASCFKL